MPTIYDNIENNLLDGLLQIMETANRADFCVGYFNLRGWDKIADGVAKLQGENGEYCRLLIGMMQQPERVVVSAYGVGDGKITQKIAYDNKQKALPQFALQLTQGYPSDKDEQNLRRLEEQLRAQKVKVKFHGNHPLHAKLYLTYRSDPVAPVVGVVGSSNLTFAGLEKNGELNVDVLDQDAAQKLSAWFEERWNDAWSMDISLELADIIKNSWAGATVPPYHIYLKTAFELSRDAIAGVSEYRVPLAFRGKMLDFQSQAVSFAAKKLEREGGVIIGDVVGLGKTLIASAVAKIIQEDHHDNVLIICPPKLMDMWEEYMHEYVIAAKIVSLGRMDKLPETRYKLIIVDESHNFRNRDSTRYGYLRDYITKNDSRVILLTATPYNKAFDDIVNQLRLFVSPEADLGIRPDNFIRDLGGAAIFKSEHPQTLVSSLAAFEKSANVDDWRELMCRYLVRRTRSHIKKNFAEYDQDKKRHYFTFADGERFYFPERKPLRLNFAMTETDTDDDYAKLYSPPVAEIINKLALPRYGLGADIYMDDNRQPDKIDAEIIKDLTRAGVRLRGFARSGLFKRLESGGDTFLLSIRRHIARNAVYFYALEQNDNLPIGQIFASETDEALDEADGELFGEDVGGITEWRHVGKTLYKKLQNEERVQKNLKWIDAHYFTTALREDLEKDINRLLQIHALVPQWKPERDRKLRALFDLVQKTHGKDKILIFTQFKDTAEYLYNNLQEMGVEKLAVAHGGVGDIKNIIYRFSPHSNKKQPAGLSELRVVVTTDTLSEGQNLQDAHIIVNYDLPWAIIRLIQRAGRVDRIGQKSPEILCYSALPEKGIETIIKLRRRLRTRMTENAELVGSDEHFFEGDEEHIKTLHDLYSGKAQLEETDDETDLLSRAFDIWRQATKDNPALAKKIEAMPNVVYSAKSAADMDGVIAYIKDGGNDILAHINSQGEVESQSQSRILDMLECNADTPKAIPAQNHHPLVRCVADELANTTSNLGGQLGGNKSVRKKLYNRLKIMMQNTDSLPLLSAEDLRIATQLIYDHPLYETARDRFRRLFQNNADNTAVQNTVLEFYSRKELCQTPKHDDDKTPRIICSMGLIKK